MIAALFTVLGACLLVEHFRPGWTKPNRRECEFQRPEMHRVHHQSGTEHLNCSDKPLWDIPFGTFQNRAAFSGNCGFTARREARLADMLQFRDVHKKLDNARSRRESHE